MVLSLVGVMGGSQLAKTSSQCPFCHKFIAKNRSWVIKLDRPISVRMTRDDWDECWVSLDTGRAYNFGGAKPKPGPRWYVHEYCFNTAQEVLYGDN